MPPTSAPRAASRFVIDIVIVTPLHPDVGDADSGSSALGSINLNTARFDNFSPLLDLGRDKLAEIFGRPMLGRDQIRADRYQPFLHGRRAQRGDRGFVKPL